MWPRRKTGFTLTETLVVIMLLSLLTSATIVLLSSVGERSRRNQLERDNLDQLRQAICELRRELNNTLGASVSTSSNQLVFAGGVVDQPEPVSVDADGDYLCETWVCYALNTSSSELWRSQLPGSRTDLPGVPPVVNLFTQRKVVARNLISFNCAPTATSQLFSLTLKVGQANDYYILNSQVGTRN